jgi:preprotein translocase subunit SecA
MLALTRIIGAFERRLDDSLEMRPAQLIELDWSEIQDGLMQVVKSNLEKRHAALLAPGGQLSQNADTLLARLDTGELDEDDLVEILMNLSVGNRMAIDARTHQRVMRKVTVLNFIFLAAKLQQDTSSEEITRLILNHLEEVQEELEVVWGKMEYERFRLADVPLSNLDAKIKQAFANELGQERAAALESQRLDALSDEEQDILAAILGRRIQNGIYRHILVTVISELWVDHLTKVDALRVSIGLEAFAQRDPLVQYKSQASEMFKELLSEIRAGVISRMFLFQPRRATAAGNEERNIPAVSAESVGAVKETIEQKKKRKRH